MERPGRKGAFADGTQKSCPEACRHLRGSETDPVNMVNAKEFASYVEGMQGRGDFEEHLHAGMAMCASAMMRWPAHVHKSCELTCMLYVLQRRCHDC